MSFWHSVGVFEHFSCSARRALVLAQVEARQMHDCVIHPEHLLLGLLREDEGIAARALSDTGADYDRVRDFIRVNNERTGRESGPEGLSKCAMNIIDRCVGISWAQADGSIGTECLLVALLEEEDETTEAVLAELDITPQEVMLRAESLLAERRSDF
jgi:ATP-dependent Clp protease ATP-binding subunit ClpC